MLNLDDVPTSWSSFVHRVLVACVAGGVLGAGTWFIKVSNDSAVNSDRITRLEAAMNKIPEIDRNIMILGGKVDVVNQKLDDAKEAIKEATREPHPVR